MHGVRLDAFSSRLLDIRLKRGNRAAPELRPEPVDALLDDDAHSLPQEQTNADFALDDEEGREQPYVPAAHAPVARVPAGSLGREVTEPLPPDVLSHGVEPTDCHTCGGHERVWGMEELTSVVRGLQERVASLEGDADHFCVSAADAARGACSLP